MRETLMRGVPYKNEPLFNLKKFYLHALVKIGQKRVKVGEKSCYGSLNSLWRTQLDNFFALISRCHNFLVRTRNFAFFNLLKSPWIQEHIYVPNRSNKVLINIEKFIFPMAYCSLTLFSALVYLSSSINWETTYLLLLCFDLGVWGPIGKLFWCRTW